MEMHSFITIFFSFSRNQEIQYVSYEEERKQEMIDQSEK